jgi:hypothetical protein
MSGASGSEIQLITLTVQNISINSTTNGAIGVSGVVSLLNIDGGLFDTIGTGNSGGAIYLNASQFVDLTNSIVQNSIFQFCSAANGGALFIQNAGIPLYNCNFSDNTASSVGSDLYENKTSSQSFYNTTNIQLCCSMSTGTIFALNDGSNLDALIEPCISPSGERYISGTGSSDEQNSCLSSSFPCATLANAISAGQASSEALTSVTVIGEFEDVNSTIGAGLVVHIHSPESGQSMGGRELEWSCFFLCKSVKENTLMEYIYSFV